ncbi:uncharacterized protein EDB93DRAFT_1243197 [Suillus bovinus]|uniref:uncharacterized protein n=1 Tax=Suillus bovinus TaxID=48563 RepID=UPI001B87F8D3|nr:uncharacterized protein EDB93DRAFT_1243197 [Suillus bovinus]KAG2130945.1 hypothetical protein EDB93DRAFT_1243197 [Suillus bovinus]
MKAFISCVLCFDSSGRDVEGGILGLVKGYYGCVEAQVLLEGALDPNEIRDQVVKDNNTDFQDRLLAFLDNSISNSLPDDPDPSCVVPSTSHHPCSVKGVSQSDWGDRYHTARQKDLHSATCYKYWKGPPQPKECRFGLDNNKYCFGEITLRCLDGMVNNFNETMLELIRCNMDIKFVGSGASAKAILYYITDYITKSQLKAHVAYAALDLACLLQKCAYSMISHQELSGPQVCSYLLDLEDHFTNHSFNNLYIDVESPSPECHAKSYGKNMQEFAMPQVDVDEADGDVNEDTEVDQIPYDDDNIEDDIDEEVVVSVNHIGELSAKPSQLLDYRLRVTTNIDLVKMSQF